MLDNYDIIGVSEAFDDDTWASDELKVITWKKYLVSSNSDPRTPMKQYLYHGYKFTDGFEYRLKIMIYDWSDNWMPVNHGRAESRYFTFDEPYYTIETNLINFNCSFSNNKNGSSSSYNFEVFYEPGNQPELSTEIFFNKVCKFVIGIRSINNYKNLNSRIVWTSIGCGVIDSPSFKINKTTRSWSFSARDLICLLDGTKAGYLPTIRTGGDAWVCDIDKSVKSNILDLLNYYASDIKYKDKGINLLPEHINTSLYFLECTDLIIQRTEKENEETEINIIEEEVFILKRIKVDGSNTIYSTILEIIQCSNPNYIFCFDNHGVPTYYKDPLYNNINKLPSLSKNSTYISIDDIISVDFKLNFDDVVNSVSVYGFTRDVTAIKDDLYSGELICDGKEYTHPLDETIIINTGITYDILNKCYILRTFGDLLPYTKEDFEYKHDKSWGCVTLFFDEKWFEKGNMPILIFVNNINLGYLHSSTNEKNYYINNTNILVWERIDEDPLQGYVPETSYWEWQTNGRKSFKTNQKLISEKYNFDYEVIETVEHSGYVDKTIQDENCASFDTVTYTAIKLLYDSIQKKYSATITVPLLVWLKPSLYVYIDLSKSMFANNKFSLGRWIDNNGSNKYYKINSINFSNGIATINVDYIYSVYYVFLLKLAMLQLELEIDTEKREVKI